MSLLKKYKIYYWTIITSDDKIQHNMIIFNRDLSPLTKGSCRRCILCTEDKICMCKYYIIRNYSDLSSILTLCLMENPYYYVSNMITYE